VFPLVLLASGVVVWVILAVRVPAAAERSWHTAWLMVALASGSIVSIALIDVSGLIGSG